MISKISTVFPVFTFFIPAKSNKTIITDKNAVIIGNQFPYPTGTMLKYEKYLTTLSFGPGANVIGTPNGKAIKITAISIQSADIIFFITIYS